MTRWRICAVALLLAIASAVAAQRESVATFAPWKILGPGEAPLKGDLVLFWIPATRDEMRRSPLITSRPLALYATQCVGLQLVRPDDADTMARLGVVALPAAILVNANGEPLARVSGDGSAINVADIEKMVRDALSARGAELERVL